MSNGECRYKVWDEETEEEPVDWSSWYTIDSPPLRYVASDIACKKADCDYEREDYDLIVKFDTGESFKVYVYVVMRPTFHVFSVEEAK